LRTFEIGRFSGGTNYWIASSSILIKGLGLRECFSWLALNDLIYSASKKSFYKSNILPSLLSNINLELSNIFNPF